ncbi:MAG: hypothetical protein ACRDZ3_04080 [Acidimicrobiia bacterium]
MATNVVVAEVRPGVLRVTWGPAPGADAYRLGGLYSTPDIPCCQLEFTPPFHKYGWVHLQSVNTNFNIYEPIAKVYYPDPSGAS